MPSPFVEAHRFMGVFADPAAVALADSGRVDAETAAKLRQRPAYTRHVSLWFSDGTFFDIQDTPKTGQYLVLDAQPDGSRKVCKIGDWIVKMPSGKFDVMSDELYRAAGGTDDVPVKPPAPWS